MLVRGGRLVSHTQESESRPVWGNTFLECLRRPQQHVESCDKPPLLLPSPRIGPKQNVCDMFCISEKKMERVVHGEAFFKRAKQDISACNEVLTGCA